MTFVEREKNFVDFPERFLKLRDELDFTHKALPEEKEVEKRVCRYDGVVGKGLNLTPMQMMLWMDRSPWIEGDLVSVKTRDFLSLFFWTGCKFI